MRIASAVVVLTLLTVTRSGAQATATVPTLGPPPMLSVPGVEHSALANGLRIELVSMHELPLAQATLVIDGGGRLDGTKPGIASFTAGMLDEGAGMRDAFSFASELEYLGATLQTDATWDAVTLTLRAPTHTMARAMTLLADAVLRPRFSTVDVTRQRDLRIAAILLERDDPQSLARRVFYRNAYPAGHPYHVALGGDSATVARLDSAAIRAFWTSAADPRHATLVVSGDLSLQQARALGQGALAEWRPPPRARSVPGVRSVTAPVPAATRIVLVDRPDAEQSMIVVGTPAPMRSSPDYAAFTLVDILLGGSFSARLNDILREQKGWVYHANSYLEWRPLPGPFFAVAPTRTDVTDSALAVLVREIRRMGTELVPEVELARARAYVAIGALRKLETTDQVAGKLVTLHAFGFPIDTVSSELAAIGRVSASDVQAAAGRHLDPAHLTVVVVGDVTKIQPGIEALGLGPIEVQEIEAPAGR